MPIPGYKRPKRIQKIIDLGEEIVREQYPEAHTVEFHAWESDYGFQRYPIFIVRKKRAEGLLKVMLTETGKDRMDESGLLDE